MVWFNINKALWKVLIIQIQYSDMGSDAKFLKIQWNNKKKENH